MFDVKADKTFEEIVERLAGLFKLKPISNERNYEQPTDSDSTPPERTSSESTKKHQNS